MIDGSIFMHFMIFTVSKFQLTRYTDHVSTLDFGVTFYLSSYRVLEEDK